MDFTATFDRSARLITVFLLLFVAGMISAVVAVFAQHNFGIYSYLGILLVVLIFAVTYGFSVTGYRLTFNHIIVRRPLGDKKIARADIQSAQRLSKGALSWSLRAFGVGGLFGYFGRFYNRKMGSMTWFLTRRDRTILLLLKDGRKIVISPDSPEAFIQALETDRSFILF